jgi:hypothetical protein
MHPLDHAVARVTRAEEHLRALIGRTALRGQAQTDAIKFGPHPTDPKIVVAPPTGLPLDPMFSILVGEVCYNLRAALDYLVFELAKLDSSAEQKQTQFPIADDAAKFRKQVPHRLKGLTLTHVTAIEALQPYKHGCEWTRRLRDWSNPDKHRTFVRVQTEHELTVHVVDQQHLHDFEDMPGAIQVVETSDGTPAYVKLRLGTELQFADGSPVIQPLEEILTQVARTLAQFKPDFG